MHLRNMNAYVASALGDWAKVQRIAAHIPLQAGPYPAAAREQAAAGARSPCLHLLACLSTRAVNAPARGALMVSIFLMPNQAPAPSA